MGERTPTRRDLTRRYLAAGAMMIMPAIFLATWLQWNKRLPETLPTHWNARGVPDGFSSTAPYAAILAVIIALATIIGIAASISRRWPAGTERFWLAGTGSVQGMATALWAVSAIVTLNHGAADGAPLGAWLFLAVGSVAWGAVPALIYPPTAVSRSRVSVDVVEEVPAEPWSDTVSSKIMMVLAVVTAALGTAFLIAFFIAGDVLMLAVSLLVLLTTIPILMIARYRITIDERGFCASSDFLRIPFKTLRLDEIDRAGAGEMVPVEWGGWGWRVMPGGSALILRKGPGITVRDMKGKEFSATLPTAHEAAATLNAYLVKKN